MDKLETSYELITPEIEIKANDPDFDISIQELDAEACLHKSVFKQFDVCLSGSVITCIDVLNWDVLNSIKEDFVLAFGQEYNGCARIDSIYLDQTIHVDVNHYDTLPIWDTSTVGCIDFVVEK